MEILVALGIIAGIFVFVWKVPMKTTEQIEKTQASRRQRRSQRLYGRGVAGFVEEMSQAMVIVVVLGILWFAIVITLSVLAGVAAGHMGASIFVFVICMIVTGVYLHLYQ